MLAKFTIGWDGKMVPYTLFYTDGMDNEDCMELFSRFSECVPKLLNHWKKCSSGQIVLPIPDDALCYPEVLAAFKKRGVHTRLFHNVYYTKKEIDSSQYFEACISYPLELEGTNSFDYGTKKIGGCPYCGLGAKTDGDILIDRKYIRKTLIGNVIPDFIVSELVKDIIDGNELSGVMFKQSVRDWKGREMPNFYAMHMSPLPPLSNSTWLNPNGFPHKTCGHEIVYLQSELRYEEDKLSGAKDFNITEELVDNWLIPSLVVSAKVRQVFRNNKIRVFFRPVTVIPKGAPSPFKPDWLN